MDDIVVKPDTPMFLIQFVAGKIVRSEFVDGIILHHMRRMAKYNIIGPATQAVDVPEGVLKPKVSLILDKRGQPAIN